MASKEKRKFVHRDSNDGQFVTPEEALRRPSETEKQRVRVVSTVRKPLTTNQRKENRYEDHN
jgi:hypothetical protein